jgi:hypothetical protein
MPVSAGIYNALAQPVRSVADYAADYDQADIRKQGIARNALLLQQGQAEMAERQRAQREGETLRNALMQLGAGASAEDRARAAEATGLQGGYSMADTLRQQALKLRDTESQIAERNAKAAKELGNTPDQILARYKGHLPYVSTPQAAQRWLQAQYQDPTISRFMQSLGPLDEAMSTIPQDPVELEKWKGAIDAKYGETLLKQREFALKANNELIGPDGMPNQKVIDAKRGIANAGKTTVSVGVNTEKTYAGNIAEGLAKNDVAALDAARSAPDRVNTARSIKQVLDSGKAITGTAAEQRLAVTKLLSTAGIIEGGSTTATEDLVSMLNTQTLDAIKTAGMGSGQGFTDKDRQFLQDAKSGRIEINAASLRRMADLNERAGIAAIEYGNKIAKRLKGNPTLGTVGQDLEVKIPDGALSKAIAEEAARRAAQRQGGGR